MYQALLQRPIHRVVNLIRHQHGAARNQPTAQGLRQNHNIRIHPEMVRRQKLARAVETRLHLIENQQRAVA